MTRCYNSNVPHFYLYGGRGIKVCDFLQVSPVNLVVMIGERPVGKSIDRPQNNLGYFCGKCSECVSNGWPMNIRWATRNEQNRNQRDLQFITLNGQTKCAMEWAEEYRISPSMLYSRINRGWTGEDLMRPASTDKKRITICGKTQSAKRWAAEIGITAACLYLRRLKGWTEAQLLLPKMKGRVQRVCK